MFDIKALHRQYTVYNVAKDKYKSIEKLSTKYFKKHSDKLKKDISEYERLLFINSEEANKFLLSHDALRRFYHIKYLKEFYDKMRKEYKNDISLVPQDERFIMIRNKEEIIDADSFENNERVEVSFMNLQNGETFQLEVKDEQEIDFIITIMDKANSYVGEVSIDDISLIMNIFNDIKNKHDDHQFTNNELYNEYRKTKHSYDITKNELLYGNLKKIIAKSKENFKNGVISAEEHKVNEYMLVIISTKNLEDLYMSLDQTEKDYFIRAYKKLSSYEYFKKYQLYFRTPSKIINEEVSLSNKKKK